MRHCLIVIFCVLAAPFSAETLVVRSGEHAEFTRLVIPFPRQSDWRVGRTDTGYELDFKQENVAFDVADVFERVPRTRLSDVVADKGRLSLVLDCACYVDAFEFQGTHVVIDVRLGQAQEGSEMERFLDEKPRIVLPIVGGLAEIPIQKTQRPVSSFFDAPTIPLEDTQQRILEGVARAASQGFLSPNVVVEAQPAAQSVLMPDAPVASVQDYLPEQRLIARAQSASERATPQIVVGTQENDPFSKCRPSKEFDVAAWGTEVSFGQQVGMAWSTATADLDGVAEQAQIDLARTYAFFGFGAEALQLLDYFDLTDSAAISVRGIAAVVDIPQRGHPETVFGDQIQCETPAALWAVLSTPELKNPELVAKTAVLRAFQSLPLHLRRHLGPTLSDRFLKAGDTATADALARFLRRAVPTDSPKMQLNAAHLAIARGNPDLGSSILSNLAESNDPSSVTAMIEVVDLHLKEGWLMEPALATLIGSRAYEMREGPLGPDMRAAHVLAEALSGQFENAMRALKTGGRDRALSLELAEKISLLVTEKADDVTFLRFTLNPEHDDLIDVHLPEIERLTSLGFPVQALIALRKTGMSEAAKVARGRAALALDQPQVALVHLTGASSMGANMLRQQAQGLLGAEGTATSVEQAWRLGDWRTVAVQGKTSIAQVAGWMQSKEPLEAVAQVPRSALVTFGQGALKKSVEDRRVLEKLLTEFPTLEDAE